MLGGVLASLGMVASSFSRNLSQLYFTAGFITGLGMCFSFQSSVTVLGFYFVRRRVLANALASMGVSLGITLWPLLSRYLLEDLGWRGTFLVFGGVFLHCCICGAIMRPVATSVAPETKECPPPPPETPALGCVAACGRTIQRHLAFDILRHNTGYCVVAPGRHQQLQLCFLHVQLLPYLSCPLHGWQLLCPAEEGAGQAGCRGRCLGAGYFLGSQRWSWEAAVPCDHVCNQRLRPRGHLCDQCLSPGVTE
ncbi:monocarboxylate transporter 6 isoform X8 [Macaca fascicularis]